MATGYKRKRVSATPKYLRRPSKKAKKTRFAGRAGIQRVVSKMINRNVETKESQERANAGLIIQNCPHNNILLLRNLGHGKRAHPQRRDESKKDPPHPHRVSVTSLPCVSDSHQSLIAYDTDTVRTLAFSRQRSKRPVDASSASLLLLLLHSSSSDSSPQSSAAGLTRVHPSSAPSAPKASALSSYM